MEPEPLLALKVTVYIFPHCAKSVMSLVTVMDCPSL